MSHFLCWGLFYLSPKLSQGSPGLWNNTLNGPSQSSRKSPGPWECHLDLVTPLIKTFQLLTAELGRTPLAVWPIIWGLLIPLPVVRKNRKNNVFWYMILWEIEISMPISKVLLEHSHVHSFTHLLWLLSHYNGRDEQLAQIVTEL